MPDLLVLCPTLNRPANVERLQASWDETAGRNWSDLVFLPGDGTLATKVNAAAAVGWDHYACLMFIGDDHVFQTEDWDYRICTALSERPGWAWPNDLTSPGKPECFAVSSEIVGRLGWMVMPELKHFYADDVVQHLSEATKAGTYLEDVIVPHLRYTDPDDATRELSLPWGQGDRDAFIQWRDCGQKERDVATVRAVLGG